MPSNFMIHRVLPWGLAALTLSSSAEIVPLDLRCDGKESPISASGPARLTWRVESSERAVAQSAWQVVVASRPELLDRDEGDLWDSGKVKAGRVPGVAYSGKPLASGQHCYWKVRTWDVDDEPSEWSETAEWEQALANPSDWRGARWIDDGKPQPADDESFYHSDPAPLMRREFTLDKPVKRARLSFVGLGCGLPSLNGERVGDQVLGPPWTAFDKRTLFSTYDVTEQLEDGANCLGIELGNVWYSPLPLRMWGGRNIRLALPTGRPRAIACLVVDHPDGTQTSVITGPEWSWAEGPTLFNSVYLGEVRDARLSLPGWNRAGFDASSWKPVRVSDASLKALQTLRMPPTRAAEVIPAVKVTTPETGVHIVDFGQNFTGLPEITVDVLKVTILSFRFGELLNADGSLNPLTSVCGQIKKNRKGPDGKEMSMGGPGAPTIAWQQDVFIANGGGPEKYRPDFTYHGFRFMEVTGLPEAPSKDACTGYLLRTDLASAGSFSCSNKQLNEIQEMCRRTFLANVVSVQSDCPHRERFGYGGDIVATSEAFLMNFDMAGFYAKTVRDWADAARPDGRLTDTAPFVGIDYCGVGWAMVHPLLIEQLYQHYGDRELLEEQYPVALKWLEVEAARRKDALVVKGLGDHEALAKAGGPVITTPMFIDAARRIGRLARLLGKEGDAIRCESLADESAAAWAEAFLNAKSGKVGEGSQSNQVLALGFGAAPASARPEVFTHLLEGLVVDDAPRLSTGIFGTRMLLEQLSLNDRSDLAYALADRKTFPSWGWMLENGATTLWEHWEKNENTFSHNHPMFGSISAWFFRWLGGIQIADDAVGADRLLIRPQTVPDLEWVKCSHRTVRGMVESNWSRKVGVVDYVIVIPPDTTALVELPAKPDEITEGGKPLSESAGIEVLANGRIKLGSGRYRFAVGRP